MNTVNKENTVNKDTSCKKAEFESAEVEVTVLETNDVIATSKIVGEWDEF